MTCYEILRPKSPPLSSENLSLYFASPTSRSTSSFVDTTMEGIPRSFNFYLFQNSRVSFAHLYFFCRCLELINQTFLKSSRPNCNNVFRPKKMNSGLYLFIFERIKAEISLNRIKPLHYESRHVLVMTTAASRKMYLHAVMISRCQGDDTFVAFQPMGIFRFWRNGKFTFFQRCLQPLYFSRSPPPTQLNLPFCAGVQFSHDYIRAFNDRIKIRENRGL